MDTNETTVTETILAETQAVGVIPLDTMIQDAETALAAVCTSQLAYEERLQAIAKDHGNTYQHCGQWYQIRSRESTVEGRKITYLCELKDEPKTWLKGPKKKAAAAAAPQEEAPMMGMSVQTIVDGVTTTVID